MVQKGPEREPHPYRDKVGSRWAEKPRGGSRVKHYLELSRRNRHGGRIPDLEVELTPEEFKMIKAGTLFGDLPPKVQERIRAGEYQLNPDEELPSGCIPGLLKLLRLI